MDKAEIRERYQSLSSEQKVIFTKLVDLELADAVLATLRRLVDISQKGRNEQAVVSAGKMIIALAEKRRVISHDSLASAFHEDVVAVAVAAVGSCWRRLGLLR